MTDHQGFEHAVNDWLAEGSDRTPKPAIDAVLLAVKTTPQERDLRIPWRNPNMATPLRLVAAIAIVAVIGFAGLTFLNPRTDGIGGMPLATPTAAPTPTPSPTVSLPGTSWILVSARLQPIEGATLAFGTDGTVSGTSGCNTYTAAFELNGEFITVGPLTLAPVACDASAAPQASVLEDALPKAASWKILSSGNLRLSGPADTQGRYYIEARPSRP
jgi:heat shock protein HslJ